MFTSVLPEMVSGFPGCPSATLSPSDSDLELLSESLEWVERPTPECATRTDLQTFKKIHFSVLWDGGSLSSTKCFILLYISTNMNENGSAS